MRVLVTGASAGIGGAICKRLARNAKRDGKTLQIAASEYAQTPDNDAIRNELEDMGAKVITPYADLSDPNGPTSLVETAAEEFGGLDAVVSNAGLVIPGLMKDLKVEDWDRVMNVNTRAGWLLGKAAYPYLKASKGAYLAIASMSGLGPHPDLGAYSPSKAACINVTAMMAIEWASDGIRCNSIAPGMIRTPFTANVYSNNELANARNDVVPLGRVGLPEDIADVAAFLLSDDARYVTGQNIVVDGGFASSILRHIPGRPSKKE